MKRKKRKVSCRRGREIGEKASTEEEEEGEEVGLDWGGNAWGEWRERGVTSQDGLKRKVTSQDRINRKVTSGDGIKRKVTSQGMGLRTMRCHEK